jgi:hypothetical protein
MFWGGSEEFRNPSKDPCFPTLLFWWRSDSQDNFLSSRILRPAFANHPEDGAMCPGSFRGIWCLNVSPCQVEALRISGGQPEAAANGSAVFVRSVALVSAASTLLGSLPAAMSAAVCRKCGKQATEKCMGERGPYFRSWCCCEAHKPRAHPRGEHSKMKKLRDGVSNKVRRAVRRTFRSLRGDVSWRTMSDDEKLHGYSNIEQFYMERLGADDLDPDLVEDGIFKDGLLKGLSLGSYHLDYSRVSKLRRIAVHYRRRWEPVERANWKRSRAFAEASDDKHCGCDALDEAAVEGRWGGPGMTATQGPTAAMPEADGPASRDAESCFSWRGSSAQWWRSQASTGGSDYSAWYRRWIAGSSARWAPEFGSDASEPSPGLWSRQRSRHSDQVAPLPALSGEADVIRYLSQLEDLHLWPEPVEGFNPVSRRPHVDWSQYTPLQKQGRLVWDRIANKAEPHVRRWAGKNPVEDLNGQMTNILDTWSWDLTKLKPGHVLSCEDATDEVLSWMSLMPSLGVLTSLTEDVGVERWG